MHMKKNLIMVLLIVSGLFLWFNYTFSYQDCSSVQGQCIYYNNLYNNATYYDSNYLSYYNLKNYYCDDYQKCNAIIQWQYQEVSLLMNNWYNNFQAGEYEESIDNYQKALNIIWDINDDNYKISQDNMVLSYNKLGDVSFKKDDLNEALKYYNKTLKIDSKNIRALYRIGAISFQKENYKTALGYFNKAYKYNTNEDDIESLKWPITVTEFRIKEIAAQKNWISYDYYSYRWLPYFKLHNIIDAWSKVKTAESYEVIVAVVDDGIDINHPDLSKNIRVNVKDMPWDKKDNDKNGYKDDHNWWNFVYNNNNLLPLWTHWTMVAWIIWAVRDNKEWIAWIVKKVKLMPIGVCSFSSDNKEWGCTDKDIIKWINYAIDNWADIINVSLGWTQFNYTNEYNQVIRRAYNKWIVVVVAAWNWDVLSNWQFWINTDTQPLSPLCNYWDNPKRIVWVAALSADWSRAEWSNYWKCAPFYSLGEWIFSTVLPEESTWSLKSIYNFWITSYNAYDFWDGTSFATPIVVWIIWLWYNKYGKVRPDLVWDALKESMGTGDVIDASKYIDILWDQKKSNPLDYNKITVWLSYKISETWYNIKRWFYVTFQSFKKSQSTIDSIKALNLDK